MIGGIFVFVIVPLTIGMLCKRNANDRVKYYIRGYEECIEDIEVNEGVTFGGKPTRHLRAVK